MRVFLRKLILGKPSESDKIPIQGTLKKRTNNLKAIWNNDQAEDIGIEKLLRLFLAISQFLFLGTYIKQLAGRKGVAFRDLSVDAFVLFKVFFPFTLLYYHLEGYNILFYIMIWFLLETILYVPTLIFASDNFSRPRSYRRAMLLLFFNYLEIVISFGVIYHRGEYLNKPFTHWFDPIYFSFITSATVGFGDFFPATPMGKFLVSAQTIIFMAYVVLFLNFFSNRVENKGYFDHTNKS